MVQWRDCIYTLPHRHITLLRVDLYAYSSCTPTLCIYYNGTTCPFEAYCNVDRNRFHRDAVSDRARWLVQSPIVCIGKRSQLFFTRLFQYVHYNARLHRFQTTFSTAWHFNVKVIPTCYWYLRNRKRLY